MNWRRWSLLLSDNLLCKVPAPMEGTGSTDSMPMEGISQAVSGGGQTAAAGDAKRKKTPAWFKPK